MSCEANHDHNHDHYNHSLIRHTTECAVNRDHIENVVPRSSCRSRDQQPSSQQHNPTPGVTSHLQDGQHTRSRQRSDEWRKGGLNLRGRYNRSSSAGDHCWLGVPPQRSLRCDSQSCLIHHMSHSSDISFIVCLINSSHLSSDRTISTICLIHHMSHSSHVSFITSALTQL